MGVFKELGIKGSSAIDWHITPDLTFTMFESWGSRERVRSIKERFYYFYIDNWQNPAKLYLMERGVKHAKIMAQVSVPQNLIDDCVASQGKALGLDRSYAINGDIKQWLTRHVFDTGDTSKISRVRVKEEKEAFSAGLPTMKSSHPDITETKLPNQPTQLADKDIEPLIQEYKAFDSRHNPKGTFKNHLIDHEDGLTVIDLATGLMWQRGGFDINAIHSMNKNIKQLNGNAFAGFMDWRLPTAVEAASLLEPNANKQGLHLHPCFSAKQPFIFLSNNRFPGGHWFIDFKQGTIFWASAVNPGGFGRVCRSI